MKFNKMHSLCLMNPNVSPVVCVLRVPNVTWTTHTGAHSKCLNHGRRVNLKLEIVSIREVRKWGYSSTSKL